MPDPASVTIDEAAETVTFNVSGDLAGQSVTTDAFSLTTFDTAAGWQAVTISSASYDAVAKQVSVGFDGPLSGQLIRFIARGAGPQPLLGAALEPFHHGQDFVYSQERS